MARIDTTKPEIVSRLILADLEPNLVYGDLFNQDFQGDLAYGSKVIINSDSDLTIEDYTPGSTTISYENAVTTSQDMLIDMSKYWAFKLYDVDNQQSINDDTLARKSMKAGLDLAKVYDGVLRDKILGTGSLITADLGDDTTPLEVGASGDVTVSEFFARMARKLDEANVGREGRLIVIPPILMEKLVLSSDFLANNESLANGSIGRYFGFDVRVTSQVSDTAGAKYKIIASNNANATRAVTIDGTELLRLETEFATGCRGYLVGGATVTRPGAVALATIDLVA